MADYIYLLEHRLSRPQRQALQKVRDTARAHGMTVFLVGGAVRDLTSGAPIRDLNFAVQGDARQLAADLNQSGTLLGTYELMQALYYSFPGGVRLEVGSTLSVTYPKPGKPAVQPASVLDDLRRRDFTANAMAISLNEGSYGLLMDPTNGVADVENRELRLTSNYGFLEEPSRMIRATRLSARLGLQLEERTRTRYDNAKAEGSIAVLGSWERRYETEAIFREEDPLRVIRKLEAEGWMQVLSPQLSSAKADEAELDRLREIVAQLNTLNVFPDTSAAVFPLVAGKLGPAVVAQLKQEFALSGFAGQIGSLDEAAKTLAAEFTSRSNAAASAGWKLLMNAAPEAVLWMAFSSKSGPAQARLKLFFNEWPQAQQRIPYQQMQEMRITLETPGYEALLQDLFFASMDGKLDSPEAIKAFLEPFSPPAAPPPPTLRRRAVKRESKAAKSRAKKAVPAQATEQVGEPEGSGVPAEAATEAAQPTSSAASPKQTATATAQGQAAQKPGAPVAPAATPAKKAQVPARPAPELAKTAPEPKAAAVRAPAKQAAKPAVSATSSRTPAVSTPPAKKLAAKGAPATAAKKTAPAKAIDTPKRSSPATPAAVKGTPKPAPSKAAAKNTSSAAKPARAKPAAGKTKPVVAAKGKAAAKPKAAPAHGPVKSSSKTAAKGKRR